MWKGYWSHRQTAKAQVSLGIRVVSPEPWQFAHIIYGTGGNFKQRRMNSDSLIWVVAHVLLKDFKMHNAKVTVFMSHLISWYFADGQASQSESKTSSSSNSPDNARIAPGKRVRHIFLHCSRAVIFSAFKLITLYYLSKKEVNFTMRTLTAQARSCENVSYATCEQQRCRSAQSDLCLCCSLLR